jgi:SAM-dependent methyltransferase
MLALARKSDALHRAELALKRKLATPFLRRLLRRPTYDATRAVIAARYISGTGIEIGAHNQPLSLPRGARVRYVDCVPNPQVEDGGGPARLPEIVSDFESLSGIEDQSCDFVIANHVLEHVESPLRALLATARVLRPGGIAFIALPNKDFSFDRPRKITPLAHIIRDFEDGSEWSRHDHYVDWTTNVERCRSADMSARVTELETGGARIHFHVWDEAAMGELFGYAEQVCGLHVEESSRNRGEVIWILRR